MKFRVYTEMRNSLIYSKTRRKHILKLQIAKKSLISEILFSILGNPLIFEVSGEKMNKLFSESWIEEPVILYFRKFSY